MIDYGDYDGGGVVEWGDGLRNWGARAYRVKGGKA